MGRTKDDKDGENVVDSPANDHIQEEMIRNESRAADADATVNHKLVGAGPFDPSGVSHFDFNSLGRVYLLCIR